MSSARAYPGIVKALKDKKEGLDLSNQQMLDIVLSAGKIANKTAADRVFSDGSEERHFVYEDTLQPFVEVFLSSVEQESVIDVKNEVIERLQESIKDKRRAIWLLSLCLAAVVLVVIIYLLFIDLPNLGYGIIRG